MIDSGIVDVNQNDEDSLSEFNRCFYERPIDYDRFTLMQNFDQEAVAAKTMFECNGLQSCSVFLDNSLFGTPTAEQNYE